MIDVMVVYTPLAKRREGGRAAIEALIDLFVVETNQAYAISGVVHRIKLVLREEVDYIEDGNSLIDLNRLKNDSDGYMDDVHELRDLYAADLVHIGGPAEAIRAAVRTSIVASRPAMTHRWGLASQPCIAEVWSSPMSWATTWACITTGINSEFREQGHTMAT